MRHAACLTSPSRPKRIGCTVPRRSYMHFSLCSFNVFLKDEWESPMPSLNRSKDHDFLSVLMLNPIHFNFTHLSMVNSESLSSFNSQHALLWLLTQFPSGLELRGTLVWPFLFLKSTSSWKCWSQGEYNLDTNPMLSNFSHLSSVNSECLPSFNIRYCVHWVVTQILSGPDPWWTLICPLIFLKSMSSWKLWSEGVVVGLGRHMNVNPMLSIFYVWHWSMLSPCLLSINDKTFGGYWPKIRVVWSFEEHSYVHWFS